MADKMIGVLNLRPKPSRRFLIPIGRMQSMVRVPRQAIRLLLRTMLLPGHPLLHLAHPTTQPKNRHPTVCENG